MHTWGDGFSFDLLGEAMTDIYSLAEQRNIIPIMKEKYGTIRYELLHSWITTPEDKELFECVLFAACQLYPTLKEKILEDWMSNYEEDKLPWCAVGVYEQNPWRIVK